jgi:hypothetical protein
VDSLRVVGTSTCTDIGHFTNSHINIVGECDLSRRQSSCFCLNRSLDLKNTSTHVPFLIWQCPSFAVYQPARYNLADSLTACGSAFARLESACLVYKCAAIGAKCHTSGVGEFLRRVSLTLYIILMFYCVEIRKAPNMLPCQCETWRDAFLCIGMPFADCLRRPACSVCLAAGGNTWWKLSTCIITLLCRGSLTSVAPCLKKYGYRLSTPLSWKFVFILLIVDPNKYKH